MLSHKRNRSRVVLRRAGDKIKQLQPQLQRNMRQLEGTAGGHGQINMANKSQINAGMNVVARRMAAAQGGARERMPMRRDMVSEAQFTAPRSEMMNNLNEEDISDGEDDVVDEFSGVPLPTRYTSRVATRPSRFGSMVRVAPQPMGLLTKLVMGVGVVGAIAAGALVFAPGATASSVVAVSSAMSALGGAYGKFRQSLEEQRPKSEKEMYDLEFEKTANSLEQERQKNEQAEALINLKINADIEEQKRKVTLEKNEQQLTLAKADVVIEKKKSNLLNKVVKMDAYKILSIPDKYKVGLILNENALMKRDISLMIDGKFAPKEDLSFFGKIGNSVGLYETSDQRSNKEYNERSNLLKSSENKKIIDNYKINVRNKKYNILDQPEYREEYGDLS